MVNQTCSEFTWAEPARLDLRRFICPFHSFWKNIFPGFLFLWHFRRRKWLIFECHFYFHLVPGELIILHSSLQTSSLKMFNTAKWVLVGSIKWEMHTIPQIWSLYFIDSCVGKCVWLSFVMSLLVLRPYKLCSHVRFAWISSYIGYFLGLKKDFFSAC